MKSTADENNRYREKLTNKDLPPEQIESQVKDMEQRSITPDTHRCRTVIKDAQELESFILSPLKKSPKKPKEEEAKKEDDVGESDTAHQQQQLKQIDASLGSNMYYVDEYQYKGNPLSHVLHFGINKDNESTQKLFNELAEAEKKSVSISTSMNSEKLKAEYDKKKVNKYEKEIMEKAYSYLLESDKKCVLIDVFDRSASKLETHTAVLVKQQEEFILLDPSNPTFSFFLKGFKDDLIISIDKNKTIYKPATKHTGPGPDLSRDCIDIAVKLAFAIQNSERPIETITKDGLNIIDASSLGLHNAIAGITNCTKVSSLLPKEVEKNVFRVKQSSNITEGKKASTLLKVFEKAENHIDQKYNPLNLEYLEAAKDKGMETKTKLKETFKDFKSFVSDAIEPSEYTSKITMYYDKFSEFASTDPELKLLGEELTHEFEYINDNYS